MQGTVFNVDRAADKNDVATGRGSIERPLGEHAPRRRESREAGEEGKGGQGDDDGGQADPEAAPTVSPRSDDRRRARILGRDRQKLCPMLK